MPDQGRPIDLAACDREPIHIPGSIQPHGVLLAVAGGGEVVAASDNAAQLWPQALGRPLGELLGADLAGRCLAAAAGVAHYVGAASIADAEFDVFAHRTNQGAIVELERAAETRPSAIEALEDTAGWSTAIAGSSDLPAAAQVAANAVRAITGYDRVMIYRFLEDGTGEVFAEARADEIAPLLNHRYPATDIPRQARALYLENPIRVIQDVGYTPVPLRARQDPIDLSGALLRSVSPVHIQYLKNMEVGASASVSIVHQGELWGLIACHHMAPRAIGHERRKMARMAALALEGAIHRLADEQSQREALQLSRRREELLPQVAAFASLREGLLRTVDELRQALPADGFALVFDDDITSLGVTPPERAIDELARWLGRPGAATVFATSRLAGDYAAAAGWTGKASGLLSLVVARGPVVALLWFRAEQPETVNWAGNPHEPLDPDAPAGTLCPRRSFEAWIEHVRERSRPWRTNEIDGARRLAAGLAEIGRVKALSRMNRYLGDALDAKEAALEEKDLLMREVHHRVQNNLQLVTSMLRLQEREIEDPAARHQLELARDRVRSISVLHRRLWRSDDLEYVNLDRFLDELVEDMANAWGAEWRGHITVRAAPIRVPGQTALLLGVIVTELLTNAFKHAYGGAAGPILVEAVDKLQAGLAVSVADRGVGTDSATDSGTESGTGAGSFGSQLVRRLVEQVSGKLDIRSNDPGTVVSLTVPAAASHIDAGS